MWSLALPRPELQSVVYPEPEVVLITSHDHCLRQGLLTSWGRQHDPDVPAIIIWHNKSHCGVMNQPLHISFPLFSPPAHASCLLFKHPHSVFDLPLLPMCFLIPLFFLSPRLYHVTTSAFPIPLFNLSLFCFIPLPHFPPLSMSFSCLSHLYSLHPSASFFSSYSLASCFFIIPLLHFGHSLTRENLSEKLDIR